jgi:hypothetical protein
MEKPYAQSAEKHARIIPVYHGVAFIVIAVNFLWTLYQAVLHFSWGALVGLGAAVGLTLVYFYSRVMALTVQDRVIRLEERLRMERLLPGDLKARIPEFDIDQLVSLRFASDDELPALARQVLDGKLTDRKVIKKMIKSWRPDFLRA